MLQNIGDTINKYIKSLSDKTIPKTVKRLQTQREINIIIYIVTIAAAGVAWMLFR